MLLRRVIDHVKAQNWTAIVLDFAIVVSGVFIGIQVSNWNGDRQNASRTQTYYMRLIDDLDSERIVLRARIAYFSTVESYGLIALNTLSDADAARDSNFLMAAYHASNSWTYEPQRSTYDEILSSGVTEAIPDPALRKKLANFYTNIESASQVISARAQYRDNIRSVLPYEIQIAIRENCNDVVSVSKENLLTLALPPPGSCAVEFDQAQVQKSVEAVESYATIEPDLTRQLTLTDNQRRVAKNNLSLIDALIPELEKRISAKRRSKP